MDIKLRKKWNGKVSLNNVTMLITSFFFSFFFLMEDFSISVPFVVIIVTVIDLLACTFYGIQGRAVFTRLHATIFVIILTIIFNLRDFTYVEQQPFYLFSLCLMAVIMLFVKPGFNDRILALNIILFSSSIVCFIVIISRFIPGFYAAILSYVSSTSREYSLWVMGIGYSGAVGASIGLTAQYVVVGIPVLLGRYWGRNDKKYLVLCVIWFIVLALIGRRGEFLAAVTSLLLIDYFKVPRTKKKFIVLGFFFLFLLLAMALMLIGLGEIKYSGDNRMINSVFLLMKGMDITSGRSMLYRVAIDLFLSNPIFGIGWGNFRIYSRTILSSVTNVHNMYLQSLCEVGIVGTIFFAVSAGYVVKYIYKQFLQHRKDMLSETTTFSMFMTIYFLVLGIFDNAIYHDEFWLLECIVFFCVYKTKMEEKELKLQK